MPLIDAFVQFSGITGSYKNAVTATPNVILDESHDGWSEAYSFGYALGEDAYPTVTIKKPVDAASAGIYMNYMRTRSRDLQRGKNNSDVFVKEVVLHLCRWKNLAAEIGKGIESDSGTGKREFFAFLKYTFGHCRILDYSTSISYEADDMPEEQVVVGFRNIRMNYLDPQHPYELKYSFTGEKM